ncbi:substrate-binding domain-containing protein [Streptosporangium sp. G11]|uniref:substrate-binding domain-containing protein n=1 Tax=Streptosporangium sp. G11 TaxID=3436926 RepID=UPI003EBEC049
MPERHRVRHATADLNLRRRHQPLENAHDVAAAERAVRELLDRTPAPTALFTMNNRITTGAVRALRGHPSPPVLIGFDELDLGDFLGVSVITHDPEEMGRWAAQLLLDQLFGDVYESARHVVLSTRLLVRDSSERPPPRDIGG